MMRKLFSGLVGGIVLAGICVFPAQAIWIKPSFSPSAKQAELIVEGEVVRSWFVESLGRASLVRVDRCCKGGVPKGTEVVVWDKRGGGFSKDGRYLQSMHSWGISDGDEYIVYLKPVTLSEYEQKHLNPDGLKFYAPVRLIKRFNYATRNEDVTESTEYLRELKFLDLFITNPPQDKRAAYRELFASEMDLVVLEALLHEWPEPLSDDDLLVFEEKLKDLPRGANLFSSLVGMFPETHVFDAQGVLQLVEKSGGSELRSVWHWITTENIVGIQDLLYSWVQEGDLAGGFRESVKILAELSPEYLKKKLREEELPRWILISCLAQLGINGSDVGREDFSTGLLSKNLDPHTLRCFDDFIEEGNVFFASSALDSPDRHADWKAGFPLFEPILAGANSPQRRFTVALFRTQGVPVVREGDGYVPHYDQAPSGCPVELGISAVSNRFVLGNPVRIAVIERAVKDEGSFCFKGDLVWTVSSDRWSGSASFDNKIWAEVDVPKEAMVVLKRGMENRAVVEIPSRRFDRPGTYRITVRKCYPHDGESLGLDAWTGMAFSTNDVVIEVVDPDSTDL
jgi:hypothetical protein